MSTALPPLRRSSVPPLETVSAARRAAGFHDLEPPNTVSPLAVPNTACSPPEIRAPRSLPPALMISAPPLKIVAELARPEERTITVPLLETVVLLAMPPASNTWKPVNKNSTPVAVPKTSCSPPEISAERSLPPALMDHLTAAA